MNTESKPYFSSERYNSLFATEEAVLKYWQVEKIFEKSLEKTKNGQVFSFYDGPPFITGLPHYATLLPSIAKDVIPRYQTMKGRFVRRVWGWDVHGLPAENQVEKRLGLKTKKDIETLGIDKFIAECRAYVTEVSESWQWYIDHIGRWVNIDQAYRTDQLSYMESVIWAFRQLYDKELIYRGRRVSLYCPRCATPLSKFEVTMDDDSYLDVEDPAVTVAFKLQGKDIYLLAWTTTPWTLSANLALAIDPEKEYVKVTNGKIVYVFAHQALERYRDQDLEILETFKGEKLVGERYEPLWEFFKANEATDYRVYAADFVAMDEGTGIVHIAPGFGEDDTKLGEANHLSLFETVDDEGHFVPAVRPWAGQYYKKANPAISADLKGRGLLFKEEVITHSYPHCYRCATPLIYKSQVSWYLKIEPLRALLLKHNQDINWLPEHFGPGRFAYNVANAPDWSLSRTRYWGTPIPVWETEDGELFIPSSLQELEQASHQKITDLHRPAIDDVVVTTPSGKPAHRVKEVLDCWFESAAMPFAQFHYPLENQAEFKASFPADFIIEYTGQLRGWFYYLHVIANALYQENSFKNVVVTGVLMGTDGRKMSKSYGNYPDPKATIEKYGAEALRLYFMGSRLMNGEDMNFNEEEVKLSSRVLAVLHNSFQYFATYANVHNWKPNLTTEIKPAVLDEWLLTRLEEFIADSALALDKFDFASAARSIRPFIEDLSTWYIRRSRDRFVSGDAAALETMHRVLLQFSLAVAPILPFTAEYIYRALTPDQPNDSVHLQNYPSADKGLLEKNRPLLDLMNEVRELSSVANMLRAEAGIPLRQPLERLVVEQTGALSKNPALIQILQEEVNVRSVLFGVPAEVSAEKWHQAATGKVFLDTKLTPELEEEGRYRDLLRKLQEARKQAGLQMSQIAALEYQTASDDLKALLERHQADLTKAGSFSEIKAVSQHNDFYQIPGEDLFIKLRP